MDKRELLKKAKTKHIAISQTETATVTNIFEASELDNLKPDGSNLSNELFWTNYRIDDVNNIKYKVKLHLKEFAKTAEQNEQLRQVILDFPNNSEMINEEEIQFSNLTQEEFWQLLDTILN